MELEEPKRTALSVVAACAIGVYLDRVGTRRNALHV